MVEGTDVRSDDDEENEEAEEEEEDEEEGVLTEEMARWVRRRKKAPTRKPEINCLERVMSEMVGPDNAWRGSSQEEGDGATTQREAGESPKMTT